MSAKEWEITKRFWKKHGGVLIDQFPAVRRDSKNGHRERRIDGVIVYGAGRRRAIEKGEALEVDGKRIRGPKSTNPCKIRVKGKRIVVIQTKTKSLSMSLLGQTLFSGHLMEEFEPASIELVALCTKSDTVLNALAKRYNIRVEVDQKSL